MQYVLFMYGFEDKLIPKVVAWLENGFIHSSPTKYSV